MSDSSSSSESGSDDGLRLVPLPTEIGGYVSISEGLQVRKYHDGSPPYSALLVEKQGSVLSPRWRVDMEQVDESMKVRSGSVENSRGKECFVVDFSDASHAAEALKRLRKNHSVFVEPYFGAIFEPVCKTEVEAIRRKARETSRCIICYDNDIPSQRLSNCQHVVCDACLCNMIIVHNKYPIVCPAESCKRKVALKNLDVAFFNLKDDRIREHYSRQLLTTAFMNFVRSWDNNFAQCKNDQCNGVLRLEHFVAQELRVDHAHETPPRVSSCSSCDRDYCKRCGNEPHGEMPCMEAYVDINCARDSNFHAWLMADVQNRRVCPVPKCFASMQKDAGCNHTQCGTCKVHFCWLCAAFTATHERAVYKHLREFHGSIGNALERGELQQRRQLVANHMEYAEAATDVEEAWEHFRLARELDAIALADEPYELELVGPDDG